MASSQRDRLFACLSLTQMVRTVSYCPCTLSPGCLHASALYLLQSPQQACEVGCSHFKSENNWASERIGGFPGATQLLGGRARV